MIVITAKNGYQFKYKGDIILSTSKSMITVRAYYVEQGPFTCEGLTVDKFFYEDVVSIRGE